MALVRFRCPHCHQTVMAERGETPVLLCPECGQPVKLPRSRPVQEPPAAEMRLTTSPAPRRARSRPSPVEEEVEEVVEVPEEEDDYEPPRRRRRYEEEEDEDEPPRPRRRKRRRRRPIHNDSEGFWPFDWLSPFLAGLIVSGALALILIPLSFLVPAVAVIGMIIGFLVNLVGAGWLLYLAAQDGELIFVLLIPFYSLFYIINHLDEAGKPFLLQIIGTLMIFACGLGIPAQESRHRRLQAPPAGPRVAWAAPGQAGR